MHLSSKELGNHFYLAILEPFTRHVLFFLLCNLQHNHEKSTVMTHICLRNSESFQWPWELIVLFPGCLTSTVFYLARAGTVVGLPSAYSFPNPYKMYNNDSYKNISYEMRRLALLKKTPYSVHYINDDYGLYPPNIPAT